MLESLKFEVLIVRIGFWEIVEADFLGRDLKQNINNNNKIFAVKKLLQSQNEHLALAIIVMFIFY